MRVLQKGQAINCSKKGLGQALGKAFSPSRLVRLPFGAGEFSLFAHFKIGLVASKGVGYNLFCFWDHRSIVIFKKAVSISWGTNRTEKNPNYEAYYITCLSQLYQSITFILLLAE